MMLRPGCVYCQLRRGSTYFGPKMFLVCGSCGVYEAHIECIESADPNDKWDQSRVDAGDDWICTHSCESVTKMLAPGGSILSRGRTMLDEDTCYSMEILKADGDSASSNRTSREPIDTTLKIFRSCFDPLIMEDGRDMLELVCRSHVNSDDPTDPYDFSGFRLAVLRKGSHIVSTLAFRTFGDKFVEIPLVATKQGYRREGNCRRLIQKAEELFQELHIQFIVLPSIPSLYDMWKNHFNLTKMEPKDISLIENHVVTPDENSAVMMMKDLRPLIL
ncbi:hypothetical protein CYMTET_56399 [Cymbomonas tetramitiformis]|uniref:N-acetyltransferase domain-containing protein n=1 Tax=Cymbomonas tetramitiformis TaxID=36881 RepID=A0AAE0BCF0_9CHLO|nr:hypothetical protein CYMTET_56399 [Cymbomonas tetramitiformis]|eukprot:gene7734-9199_t